nr:MAG: hypothetical protein [Rhizoctonia solani beny-like virus 6]
MAAVQRDVVRDLVYREWNLQNTTVLTRFHGATAMELKRTFRNDAISYDFHGGLEGSDSKDSARIGMPMLDMVLKELNRKGSRIASAGDVKSKLSKRLLRFGKAAEVAEAMKLAYDKGDETVSKRFSTTEESGPATLVVVNDAGYNKTEHEWVELAAKTGCNTIVATMFIPDEFFDPNVPENKYYNYREEIVVDREIVKSLRSGFSADATTELMRMCEAAGYLLTVVEAKKFIDKIWGWVFPLLVLGGATIGVPQVPMLPFDWTAAFSDIIGSLTWPVIAGWLTGFLSKKMSTMKVAAVTWKDGRSQGYVHSKEAWSTLPLKARLQHPHIPIVLNVEEHIRVGNMVVYTLTRTSGSGVIAFSPSLPKHREYVRIMDLFESWNPATKSWRDAEDWQYFSVPKKDWDNLFAWCTTQDPKAFTLRHVMNACRRLSKGLAIGKNEWLEPWDTVDEVHPKLAVAAMVYTTQTWTQADLASMAKPEQVTNFDNFLAALYRGTKILFTAGLILPFDQLLRWAQRGGVRPNIVTYPSGAVVTIIPPVRKEVLMARALMAKYMGKKVLDEHFSGYVGETAQEEEQEKPQFECPTCGLLHGKLGKQIMMCKQAGKHGKQEIEWTEEDVNRFRMKLNETAMEIPALAKLCDMAKDAVPASGMKVTFKLDMLEGPPGTGKSYTVREWIRLLEDDYGEKVAVVAPFLALAGDYHNVRMPNGELRKFVFKTPHRAFELAGLDTIFVDEMGAYDADLLVALAHKTGAKRVVLVGDLKQTLLREEEGTPMFDATGGSAVFDTEKIAKHTLVYNFRNTPEVVAILNMVFGYSMLSARQGETADGRPILVKAGDMTEEQKKFRSLIFAKASYDFFGLADPTGNKGEKVTVRANQGQTYDNVKVSLTATDDPILDVHGMLCVALSRARKAPVFVFSASEYDDVVVKWKRLVRYEDWTPAKLNAAMKVEVSASAVKSKGVNPERGDEILAALQKMGCLAYDEHLQHAQDFMKAVAEHETHQLDVVEDLIETQKEIDAAQQKFDAKLELTKKWLPEVDEDVVAEVAMTLYLTDGEDVMTVFRRDFPDESMELDLTITMQLEEKSEEKARKTLERLEMDMQRRLSEAKKAEEAIPFHDCWKKAMLGETGLLDTGYGGVYQFHVDRIEKILKKDPSVLTWPVVEGKRMVPMDVLLAALEVLKMPVIKVFGKTFVSNERFDTLAYAFLSGIPIHDSVIAIKETEGHVEPMSRAEVEAFISKKKVAVELFALDNERYSDKGLRVGTEVPAFSRWTGNVLRGVTSKWHTGKVPVIEGIVPACPVYKQTSVQVRWVNAVGFLASGMSVLKQSVERTFSSAVELLVENYPSAHRSSCYIGNVPDTVGFSVCRDIPTAGFDDFRLLGEIDHTEAWHMATGQTALNEGALNIGFQKDLRRGTTLQRDAMLFPKTRRGNLAKPQKYRTFVPGTGLHYSKGPVDTAYAGTRYFGLKKKFKPSHEGMQCCRAVYRKAHRELLDPMRMGNFDSDVFEELLSDWSAKAASKGYGNRAEAGMNDLLDPATITFTNKDQFKPTKGDKGVNPKKVGQGISQMTGELFMSFPLFRAINHTLWNSTQAGVFYDQYDTEGEYCLSVTKAISDLPSCAQVGIMDAVEFDSTQDWWTLYLEYLVLTGLGVKPEVLTHYYSHRTTSRLISYGVLAGRMDGEKPSGFHDTLLGNSVVSGFTSSALLSGKGPKVVCMKGDDYLRVQAALTYDKQLAKKISTYSAIKIDGSITGREGGFGGEFTGHVVTKTGMYPSVTRAVRRALAVRYRDYTHFAQAQIAMRDKVQSMVECGVEECIAVAVAVEGVSPEYARLCFDVLYSLSHLGRKDWESYAKVTEVPFAMLPGAREVLVL